MRFEDGATSFKIRHNRSGKEFSGHPSGNTTSLSVLTDRYAGTREYVEIMEERVWS